MKSNQIVKAEDKISDLKDCAKESEPYQTECLSNSHRTYLLLDVSKCVFTYPKLNTTF